MSSKDEVIFEIDTGKTYIPTALSGRDVPVLTRDERGTTAACLGSTRIEIRSHGGRFQLSAVSRRRAECF